MAYTKKQLMDAAAKAKARGLDKEYNELISAAQAMTGPGEQALTGLYEGLATGVGMPVDLATAAINKGLGMFGVGPIQNPVGGSQSVGNLLDVISGGEAIRNTPPPATVAQRVARRTTQEIGGAAPMAVALPVAGARALTMAARTGTRPAGAATNLAADVSRAAQAAPLRYSATEIAAATGGGLGASAAQEAMPGSAAAEIIGQVIGGGAGAGGYNLAERLATPPRPVAASARDMKDMAGDMYNDQRVSGLSVQPQDVYPIYDRAFRMIDEQGIIKPDGTIDADYTKVASVLSDLKQYGQSGMTGAQLLAVRQGIANRAKDAAGTSEGTMLKRILREFDTVTSTYAPEIATANDLYHRAAKADTIERMLEVSDIRSQQFSQSGLENAIRSEFRQLAIKIAKGQEVGWTPAEIEEINMIAKGGPLENSLRFIGRLAPKGIVSLAASGALPYQLVTSLTGNPSMGAAVAGGTMASGLAANTAAGALQQRRAMDLYRSMLSREGLSPEGQKRLEAAIKAYLASVGANAAASPEGLNLMIDNPSGND
jgi:hypothetical protein